MITTRELTLPSDLVSIDRNELKFIRTPTWEEWQVVMEYCLHCRKASLRWMADTSRAGRSHFGDEAVEGFQKQLTLTFPEVKDAAALESMELRLPDVSDEVHLKIAQKFSDPADQEKWLAVAAENGLKAREVQWSIASTPPGKAPVIVREGAPSRKAGVMTIGAVLQDFENWKRQQDIDLAKMDVETLDLLTEHLRPMYAMYQEAQQLALEKRGAAVALDLEASQG